MRIPSRGITAAQRLAPGPVDDHPLVSSPDPTLGETFQARDGGHCGNQLVRAEGGCFGGEIGYQRGAVDCRLIRGFLTRTGHSEFEYGRADIGDGGFAFAHPFDRERIGGQGLGYCCLHLGRRRTENLDAP